MVPRRSLLKAALVLPISVMLGTRSGRSQESGVYSYPLGISRPSIGRRILHPPYLHVGEHLVPAQLLAHRRRLNRFALFRFALRATTIFELCSPQTDRSSADGAGGILTQALSSDSQPVPPRRYSGQRCRRARRPRTTDASRSRSRRPSRLPIGSARSRARRRLLDPARLRLRERMVLARLAGCTPQRTSTCPAGTPEGRTSTPLPTAKSSLQAPQQYPGLVVIVQHADRSVLDVRASWITRWPSSRRSGSTRGQLLGTGA